MLDYRRLALLRLPERVVAGKAICIDPALEPGEVALRALALAVRRVAVERHGWPGPAPGLRIIGTDPNPRLASLAPARRQEPDRRVVGPDHLLAAQ